MRNCYHPCVVSLMHRAFHALSKGDAAKRTYADMCRHTGVTTLIDHCSSVNDKVLNAMLRIIGTRPLAGDITVLIVLDPDPPGSIALGRDRTKRAPR